MSKHIGTTLDSLLDELGEKDDVELLANKKVVADTLQQRMKALSMTTTTLATRMKTSRNQVHRLLDPQETGVTFKSLDRASRALGLRFEIRLAPDTARSSPAKSGRRTVATKALPSRRPSAKR